ncbi:MAG: hypothetical protein AMJ90_05520 [candidate division Zixibacteria bacterium SM23_73_2]|nr:MAG: hypothetical protein AMJ90_05520 [candidate division Zixibacteria bacterium SM23_73_2]
MNKYLQFYNNRKNVKSQDKSLKYPVFSGSKSSQVAPSGWVATQVEKILGKLGFELKLVKGALTPDKNNSGVGVPRHNMLDSELSITSN